MGSRTRNGGTNHSGRNQTPDERLNEKALSPRFDASSIEDKIYQDWETHRCFHADPSSDKAPFTIVIPPPNVTGVLHMGHALDNTLQDILIRYKRMDGFEALWMPGTDHAGIATQAVVEKQLEAEGLSKEDLGREKFVSRVWEWKEASEGKIIHQLKRLGASCDWERERFTLDEGLSKAVRQIFVKLYEEGLIYRSSYLVNWSPKLKSAVSDLEVDYKDVQGHLYYFKYPLSDASGHIEVATTRPETLLGDVAVAVHPEDARFSKWLGKTLAHPLVDRKLMIIADDYVDPKFGTGAVKITPAHDPNDYEMGQRHKLELISIMDESGFIDCEGSPFHKMERFEARKAIVAALKQKNLFVKKEPYTHSVGHCQRTGVVIEPRVSKQWFVKVKSLAEPAIEAVQTGETHFVPKNWTKTYLNWMNNIKDWCISRQLWWGHQIPVWYCASCDHMQVALEDPIECASCQGKELTQDPDVLDTWFSSGLWPFSTLGWPEKTAEYKKFYPTSVLVTGFDIIFFWVARMMMLGIKFTQKAPFKTIHIHALIRDADGQKMSKSKGNVIDPIELMDKYGTDAFRFSLTAFAAQGRDILLSEQRIEGYRNFITKLWNASRFASQKIDFKQVDSANFDASSVHALANRWILSALNQTILEVRRSFEEQKFNDAAQALYQFIWNDLCDWYLELSKVLLESDASQKETQETLAFVLDQSYRLLHPIAPFVTEELWQTFFSSSPQTNSEKSFLMKAPFPQSIDKLSFSPENELCFAALKELTEQLRNFRSENNIPPKKDIPQLFLSFSKSKLQPEAFTEQLSLFKRMCGLSQVEIKSEELAQMPQSTLALGHKSEIQMLIPWENLIDTTAEKARLDKLLKKHQSEAEKLSKQCEDKKFLKNAPQAVVEKTKLALDKTNKQIEQISEQLDQIHDG